MKLSWVRKKREAISKDVQKMIVPSLMFLFNLFKSVIFCIKEMVFCIKKM